MKVYINDEIGYEWAYDTKQSRFYLNSPVLEKELGETNGEVCDLPGLRSLIIGRKAAWDFDRKKALNFLEVLKNLGVE